MTTIPEKPSSQSSSIETPATLSPAPSQPPQPEKPRAQALKKETAINSAWVAGLVSDFGLPPSQIATDTTAELVDILNAHIAQKFPRPKLKKIYEKAVGRAIRAMK